MGDNRFCVYTQFDNEHRPLVGGILDGDRLQIFKFFAKGGDQTTLYQVAERRAYFKSAIETAINDRRPVVTVGFKDYLDWLEMPIDPIIDYSSYDLCWSATTATTTSYDVLAGLVQALLQRMATVKLQRWQRACADAAPVYQYFQQRGFYLGHLRQRPRWSQTTFSGRSKVTGVNVQGLDDSLLVVNPDGSERDIFVQFDWIAADINVAAWLADDDVLRLAFDTSDPYSYLASIYDMERSECKLALLSALNSLNIASPVMLDAYQKLGRWLAQSKLALLRTGELETVLGRKFNIKRARNELAVFNGVMQGSVAHAMHLILPRVWAKFRTGLLLENHDSLVMTVEPNHATVSALIDDIAAIMVRPFAGLTLHDGRSGDDFFFPVRVNIGRKYKQWSPCRTYRSGGISNA